jgi:hypothetical protein
MTWTIYPDLTGTGGHTITADNLQVTDGGALMFFTGGVLVRVVSPDAYGYVVRS